MISSLIVHLKLSVRASSVNNGLAPVPPMDTEARLSFLLI